MNYPKQGLVLILSACVCLLSSCLKETLDELRGIKGIKASGEFAAPLMNASIGMKEIYDSYSNKAFIREAPDHLLVFSYSAGDTVEQKQFVAFPPALFNFNFQMNNIVYGLFVNDGKLSVDIADTVKIPLVNNEKLKLLSIKKGHFNINVVNSFRHNLTIVLTYPTIRKNGQPLTETISIPYDPNNFPASVSRPISLDGYDIDLSNGGITSNTLPFEYKLLLERIPGNPTDLGQDHFGINQEFMFLESFNEIRGYLGRFNILTSNTNQEIDLFDKQTAGKIFVHDPKIVIRVYNSYGVPVTGRINNLRVETASGSIFPVIIEPFKDTFSFAYPVVPGQVAMSEYVIDKHNSNIDDAINISPVSVKYDVDFDANYNETEADNFLTDDAVFVMTTDMEMPLDVKIVDYIAEQPERPKESDTSELKYVDQARLTIRTENTLPFDLFAQMIFTRDTVINGINTSYVTDSLFYPELPVSGAVVDANGQVVAPTVTTSSVVVDKARYNHIQRSQNYILRIRLQSSTFGGSQSFVKIYSTQKLNMKIGADIKLTYKSNE
jgi:hypothetical protein